MHNKSLVSIIIPCYNDAIYIEQSVQSALNQTYSNIEVIVVDDGSDTATKAVLKKIEPKITQLITQTNRGQSTARNVGIQNAKGEFIVVLDSDDFFEPTFCTKAITEIQNESVKIVSCYGNIFYRNGHAELYQPSGGALSEFLYSNCVFGSVFFRKESWLLAGGYDQDMRKGFEDWEFYIRLLKNGGTAHIIKECLFNYRRRNNSTTAIANRNIYTNWQYILTKNKNLYIDNYERTISFLLDRIMFQEKERYKNLERIEYKIGFQMLRPFRFLKKIFK